MEPHLYPRKLVISRRVSVSGEWTRPPRGSGAGGKLMKHTHRALRWITEEGMAVSSFHKYPIEIEIAENR